MSKEEIIELINNSQDVTVILPREQVALLLLDINCEQSQLRLGHYTIDDNILMLTKLSCKEDNIIIIEKGITDKGECLEYNMNMLITNFETYNTFKRLEIDLKNRTEQIIITDSL